MSSKSENHRAKVDSEGNIILPFAASIPTPHETLVREVAALSQSLDAMETYEETEDYEEREEAMVVSELADWTDIEPALAQGDVHFMAEHRAEPELETVIEDYLPPVPVGPSTVERIQAVAAAIPIPDLTKVREKAAHTAVQLAREGGEQYASAVKSGGNVLVQVVRTTKDTVKRLRVFLVQPVWVPGKHKAPKQRSRGMLFLTDVVRFGGTFATLFLVLFTALNYQSFFQIVKGRIDPLSQIQAKDIITQELTGMSAKLKQVPSLATAGSTEGDLLAFLPPVGPPENRLVIPKLDLNVPIVIPLNDALLREDWKKLEEDIQQGLQDGVVHYPGTAKPGQAGNFFLTGHSSYFPWAPGDFKSVFARLHALNVGDEYWVFYGGDRHRFIIQEKKEVKPTDVSVLDQPLNERISTLMTCTPVGTTLRRLIIVAQEVHPETGEALEVGEHEKRDPAQEHKLEMLPI